MRLVNLCSDQEDMKGRIGLEGLFMYKEKKKNKEDLVNCSLRANSGDKQWLAKLTTFDPISKKRWSQIFDIVLLLFVKN